MTATTRGDLRAIDDLEVAFARLGPVVKARMHSISARIHPELRPAGWTVLRIALIHASKHPEKPLAVSDIIAETQMDKSVVSRQLRDLKEWGLVTLTRSTEDARVFIVAPTPEAEARLAVVHEAARDEYRSIFAAWDPSDVRKLVDLLTKLAESGVPQT